MKKRIKIQLAYLNSYVTAKIFKRSDSALVNTAANVVLSMTSYGWRLQNVHKTIISLFAQDLKPAKILLFVAEEDKLSIPSILWELTGSEFEIRICEDIRSYKKIIPALKWLNSIESDYSWLVLCDDDVIYPKNWFSSFNLQARKEDEAVAHRCHLVAYGSDGNYLRYSKWRNDVADFYDDEEPFATGVGGIAIPFRRINKYFYQTRDFIKLAPTADDVWIYFMLKYSGIKLLHSGYRFKLREWTELSPQHDSKLWVANCANDADGFTENDKALIRCRTELNKLFNENVISV